MAGGATCPHCARPVAAAQPRCVYCGGELPAEAVEAATAARAALEAEWAREGTSRVAGLPATPDATATPRVLLVLVTARADEAALARALSLSAFEASQRRRRGGPDLHRSRFRPRPRRRRRASGPRGGRAEIAEEEVRRAEPVMATRAPRSKAPRADGDGGRSTSRKRTSLAIVRGVITASTRPRWKRASAAWPPSIPVIACTCTAARTRPVGWIPPLRLGLGGRPAARSSRRELIERLFPGVPRRPFRVVIPALARLPSASARRPWPRRRQRRPRPIGPRGPGRARQPGPVPIPLRLARGGAAPRPPHSLSTMSIDITAARSRSRRGSSGRMLSAMVSM